MSIVGMSNNSFVKALFVMLAVAAMSVMIPREAAAKHKQHIAHHHVVSEQARNAQADTFPQSTSMGAMRYYGGPKSPMWREVSAAPVSSQPAASSGRMRYYGGPKSPMWREVN